MSNHPFLTGLVFGIIGSLIGIVASRLFDKLFASKNPYKNIGGERETNVFRREYYRQTGKVVDNYPFGV